ncbi:MAG: YybH family protein [Rhodothalassiaceae bacterium]
MSRYLAVTMVILLACATPVRADDAGDIRAVLNAQTAAWNAGDLEAFMDGYWRSPDLRFVSGNQVTRGWQATLERYQQRYDTAAKRGTLQFSQLDIQTLGPADRATAAHVFGRFTLRRPVGDATGLFTLVLRKINGQWRIVADHTSS